MMPDFQKAKGKGQKAKGKVQMAKGKGKRQRAKAKGKGQPLALLMIIAVNARFLVKPLEGYGYFSYEVLRRLVTMHPEHQFHFLFDRAFDPAFLFGENMAAHVVPPPARHPVLWKIWFDWKVPAVLRKIKADVFLSADGYCSLRTRVPQCMVVHDLGFLHFPETYKKTHALYYKRYTNLFLRKATTVAAVSQFTKNDLLAHYPIAENKISVVYSAAKQIFTPVNMETRMQTLDQYTGGAEYFVYAGAIHPRKNLVNLLKAFSIFKKRLQSSMKLVLVGRLAWKNDDFRQLLATYKYREDVVLTGYIAEDEVARLIASSYALVYPSLFEGFGVPVLEGMQSYVPVLTSRGTSMEEIGDDAALYFDPNDVSDMAEKLMLIYKDEALRSRLIEKGKSVAANYSWDKTAELVWQAIGAAVSHQP